MCRGSSLPRVAWITGPVPPSLSAVRFFFDFGNRNTLQMHYWRPEFGAQSSGSGRVAPVPRTNPQLVDVTWITARNPVPGSGTGIFQDVIGSRFLMMAIQDSVDLASADLPHTWSCDVEFLTVVPEPNLLILTGPAVVGLFALRRRAC